MPTPQNPQPADEDHGEAYDRAEKAIRAAQAALDRASVSGPEIPAELRVPGDAARLRAAREKPTGPTTTSSMSIAYGLAFELGVYLIVCTAAGWLADRYLVGSGRTWTLVGAGFGLVGGMIRTIRGAAKMYKAMDAGPGGSPADRSGGKRAKGEGPRRK